MSVVAAAVAKCDGGDDVVVVVADVGVAAVAVAVAVVADVATYPVLYDGDGDACDDAWCQVMCVTIATLVSADVLSNHVHDHDAYACACALCDVYDDGWAHNEHHNTD